MKETIKQIVVRSVGLVMATAFGGTAIGAVAGLLGVLALPATHAAGGFLTGLGFQGLGWLWPFVLPPLAAFVAFAATRAAALRTLRELT